jgi:hypothetical protein
MGALRARASCALLLLSAAAAHAGGTRGLSRERPPGAPPLPQLAPGGDACSALPPAGRGTLAALRGGALGAGLVGGALRSVWRLLRLQLVVLLLVTFWPIPVALFFYWLMHAWFGAEGSSMIAFTGIR